MGHDVAFLWRRWDSNPRSPSYEPGEMTNFSTALFFKPPAIPDYRNNQYHDDANGNAPTDEVNFILEIHNFLG